MTIFLALYSGPDFENVDLRAVTANQRVIQDFAVRLFEDDEDDEEDLETLLERRPGSDW
jgi:hypothetical protein